MFDEKERREFDTRFKLLVSIQYEISLYQAYLFKLLLDRLSEKKLVDDYKKLSEIQAKLTSLPTATLHKLNHDISLKLKYGENNNEK